MNKLVFFCALVILLNACNNEKAVDLNSTASELPAKEQMLKDAIKQFPDSLMLREKLMQYYAENANYSSALREVNDALLKDSLNFRLWDIKATLHFEDNDTVNAIQAFERSVSIYPNTGTLISLATIYAQTKNEKAIIITDTLLSKPKLGAEKEAYFVKGLYYSFTNEKMKAIGLFDKCLALNFTFMDCYREKAIALYDLGKYEEALTVLDKALTLQNNFDEGYYYSGRCLEKLNRIPEAIQSYQNALLLDPDYIEAKDALGRLGVKG